MEYKEENIEKGQPHGYKDRQVVKLVSHKDTKGTDELATNGTNITKKLRENNNSPAVNGSVHR